MKPPPPQLHRVYLLRCWREDTSSQSEPPAWRFMVEEVLGKRRRRGFSQFEEMINYLRSCLAVENPET